MQQIFQCYRCGAKNYPGQASCWNCHERFQYYCPWCNALTDPILPNCPNCRATLPWQAQQPAAYQPGQDGYKYEEDAGKPANKAPWIIALACLALITAITLVIVNLPGILKQPDQSVPAAQSPVSQPAPTPPAPTPARSPMDNTF